MFLTTLTATPAAQKQPDPLRGLGAEARKAVQSAVTSTASYKGYPWSATEYEMQHYYTKQAIEEEHGKKAAAAFEQLMARQPVRGGRFNPWSGD